MAIELRNNVVVVTGGAEGLGYAIVDHFLQEDVKLALILDINEKKGSEAAEIFNSKYGENKAVFIKCDVTKDLEAVSETIFDTYGYVGVLVNNAGIADETSARRTLEVNTLAVMEWSIKFWERMRTDKGGRGGTIVNISSIYGLIIDKYGWYYKASKFAVVGFSRCLGHEDNFKDSGVRVLTLWPGFTKTSLTKDLNNEFMKTQIFQEADDVGKAVVEMYKNGNSGTVWTVIGGELTQKVLS